MTEQNRDAHNDRRVSDAELNLIIKGQDALREDFQLSALQHREDFRRLTDSQIDLHSKFSTYIEKDHARERSIEEIKEEIHDPETGINRRLTCVEKLLAVEGKSNTVKWKMLGTAIMSFFVIGGTFAGFIYFLIRNIPIAE